MAASNPSKPTKPPQPHTQSQSQSHKRKAPPSSTPRPSSSTSQPPFTSTGTPSSHPPRRPPKRSKLHDARTILTQTSDAAFLTNKNDTTTATTPASSSSLNGPTAGALDLNAFLQAREFEIKALEDGLRRSRAAGMARAFQQLPRELRRRTASHNAKRVPRRLRPRAVREMKEDKTPTGGRAARSKGRAKTTRARLRSETAKRLEGLAARKREQRGKKEEKEKKQMDGIEVELGEGVGVGDVEAAANQGVEESGIVTRKALPKVRMNTIDVPLVPRSKFRKRQIHKTWLPTHLWHAKRARMTEPKHPYWRMAIPITPTEKSYRPTHRAGSVRGTVCWDKSYVSTIGLEGTALALEKVLRGLGISDGASWENHAAGVRWRAGKRSWSGWLSREEGTARRMIAPATIVWCGSTQDPEAPREASDTIQDDGRTGKAKVRSKKQQVLIRIHPAAFLESWNELLRLAKKQRPPAHVEDLRFQIGSIDITGPASTEALLGILHPFDDTAAHSNMFLSLAGLTNPAALPPNAILSFDIEDPRLRYPPRKSTIAQDEQAEFTLLENISKWSPDSQSASGKLFDRLARHRAGCLPSQKAINRRKALASRGTYPARTASDPSIPIMLLASRRNGSSSEQGTWTLLAPWKCILPIWYGLVHCPLNSGSTPRFGGLQETQQIDFEHQQPWFPGDRIGTLAGWMWELQERVRRRKEWRGRPRGKRIEYESINLGTGRKGEIGRGWACDFERLLGVEAQEPAPPVLLPEDELHGEGLSQDAAAVPPSVVPEPTVPIHQIDRTSFLSLLQGSVTDGPANAVATVRISLFTKGVPQSCARIYRLPSPSPPSMIEGVPTTEAVQRDDDSVAVENMTEPVQVTQPAQKPQPSPVCPRAQWLALDPSRRATAPSPSSRSTTTTTTIRKPSATSNQKNSDNNNNTVHPDGLQRTLVADLLRTPALPYPATTPRVEELHPPIPREADLIGFVTTGNFNLARGTGSALGSVLVCRVPSAGSTTKVGKGEKGGERARERERARESRMCVVRNAGETVGRLGIWEAV